MSKEKSPLPSGAMAAIAAGWYGHDPYIATDSKGNKTLSLWGPLTGPNKDWEGTQIIFEMEDVFAQWIKWAEDRGRREVREQIKSALAIKDPRP